MLSSEFAVVGTGGDGSMGMMDELLDDLRRTCTSTSYTYLFAVEVLQHLVHTAEERTSSTANQDRSLVLAVRKWTRLREEFDCVMMDPSVSSKTAGSSSLHKKRRREMALTLSELHQRRRRRLRPGVDENANLVDENRNNLEAALSTLLLRHSESKKLDDQVLDQLLSSGITPKEVGKMLTSHPLAIKALLGHLFLPGTSRAGSLLTRTKCARLVALAVLAAEACTKTERGFEDPAKRQTREEELKGMLLTGSQMCELVENMVSFAVSSEIEISKETKNPSAGVKLSVLANKSAPVAQGVVMWATELVSSSEYVGAASYPTLSPSILSLLRILITRHPFTRPSVLQIALQFLGHSNTEISYQKLSEIKQQALRLLIFLLMQGEVTSVLGNVATRLTKGGGAVNLDASLIRYFMSGLLDVVSPPCSPVMVVALGKVLLTPKCVEALKSTYFPADKMTKLKNLIGVIRVTLPKGKKTDASKTLLSLMKTYT